jgi:hypothetical protein
MMLALVLALLAQGEHTAQVFAYFAHTGGGNVAQLSYAFAAAVEVAVLLFVLKGHKYISYGFALATFATNLVYYAIGGINLLSVAIFPVVLLSALLPGVIVGYSHTIAETPQTDAKQPQAAAVRRWVRFWKTPLETPATPVESGNTPTIEPSPSCGHSEATSTIVQPAKAPRKSTSARIAAEYGITVQEIVDAAGVKRQAVEQRYKRGTLGALIAQLPQPVRVTTNGYHETEVQ